MERLSTSRADRERSRRANRRAASSPGGDNALRLAAVGVDVIPLLAADRPLIAALVAEDACWQIAVEAWLASKPTWFEFAARSRWRAQRAALDAKRTRIREDAAALGYRAAPPVRNPNPLARWI